MRDLDYVPPNVSERSPREGVHIRMGDGTSQQDYNQTEENLRMNMLTSSNNID